MRKMLTFLLALMLLCPAALADVQSQVNAPTAYNAVWQSNTGKTIITVDAVVEIPGAQQMMVYPTSQRKFSTDDMRRVAEACFGDMSYGTVPDSLEYFSQRVINSAPSDPTFGTVSALEENAAGRKALLSFVEYHDPEGKLWYGEFQFEGRGLNRYQLIDLPLMGTVDPACREKAIQIARAIEVQMGLAYEGRIEGYPYEGNGPFDRSGHGNMFIFTRMIDGEPVTWTNRDCQAYDNFQDTYNRKIPYETITVIIDQDDGAVWLQWNAPHTIDIASGQAAALLPFDQIMGVAAQLLPLKYQYGEINMAYRSQDANRLAVGRITLSYSRVQNRDNPTGYMMVPVWDFFNAENPAESLLTINAVDGTVIDRGFGY
jgi:hypothetical protein